MMNTGQALAFVRENGHRNVETAFADWLPAGVACAATDISVADALVVLGPWA